MTSRIQPIDAGAFAGLVRQRLAVRAIPSLDGMRLHLAGPESGLSRLPPLRGASATQPYWAWLWGGGAALARYILDNPGAVRGARVADIGCGGGVVALAVALAGAKIVSAIDIDPRAAIVARLNAEANGVVVNAITADAFAMPASDADIVVAGDVAYEAALAHRALGWLRLCRAAGCQVLVGDPGRRHLPLPDLVPLAHMRVPDFGAVGDGLADAAVYRLRDAS